MRAGLVNDRAAAATRGEFHVNVRRAVNDDSAIVGDVDGGANDVGECRRALIGHEGHKAVLGSGREQRAPVYQVVHIELAGRCTVDIAVVGAPHDPRRRLVAVAIVVHLDFTRGQHRGFVDVGMST